MSVAGVVNVGKKVSSAEVSPSLAEYSRVMLFVTDELYHESGDYSGRTLELKPLEDSADGRGYP